jgi:hypothetical protein
MAGRSFFGKRADVGMKQKMMCWGNFQGMARCKNLGILL